MSQGTTEWVDARELLEAAIAELEPGEMVKSEDTTLTQLMSAIEVGSAAPASELKLDLTLCVLADYGPSHRLLPFGTGEPSRTFPVRADQGPPPDRTPVGLGRAPQARGEQIFETCLIRMTP